MAAEQVKLLGMQAKLDAIVDRTFLDKSEFRPKNWPKFNSKKEKTLLKI